MMPVRRTQGWLPGILDDFFGNEWVDKTSATAPAVNVIETDKEYKVETLRRAKAMIAKMDELGFGGCTNTRACEAECPKSISISHIARLNRKFLTAKFKD